MTVRSIVLALLALLASSCSDEITRTQLTFRISAGRSVRDNIQSLHVEVSSKSAGVQKADFPAKDLNWPVEIPVVSLDGQNSTSRVDLLVQARGADDAVLAEKSANGNFKPEQRQVVDVGLGDDAVLPSDDDAGSEETVDARSDDPPDAGSKVDSSGSPPPDNCETNSKITCSKGNLCTGDETCDPASSNADAKGCVPSSTQVMCANDMTCDITTGECSTCVAKSDGDGDKVNSIACGGLDCNDADKDVAPGKTEKCNNRDDDCDGTRDGTKADADCAAIAPTGGTASCVGGRCTGACTKAGQQIVNGECKDPPVGCPAMACLPGRCAAGSPSYVCTCPTTHRAGLGNTRCAPIGVPTRTLGFETSCANVAIPSPTPPEETIPITATQFAACGVAAITSGPPTAPVTVKLVRPATMSTAIVGITEATALEVPAGTASSELSIGFAPPMTEVSFDILDIDSPLSLSVTLRSGEMTIPGVVMAPVAPSKSTRFSYLSPALPVDLVVLKYTPPAPVPPATADRLFIDQLSYRVGGCGDMVKEGVETCDDADAMQCNGCDNACALSSATSPGCGM